MAAVTDRHARVPSSPAHVTFTTQLSFLDQVAMRFEIDLVDTEVVSLLNQLIAITGIEPWARKFASLQQQLNENGFISSQYCYEFEVAEAMRRHAAREAVVIPVILRPCKWQGLPFGKLQAATLHGRPVQKYPTLDEGFLDVVQSIEAAAQRIKQRPESAHGKAPRRKAESTAVGGGRGAAHGAPRSSNLSVKKTFTDHERDTFRVTAFEYISAFFENSLNELEARNRHLKKHFRSRDANSFEAAVYAEGKVVARCGIWLSSDRHFGELNYSDSGLGNGNSYNETLSVADDGQALGLKALGIGSFAGGRNDKNLTLEGAAEYLWSMFIRPLQER